MVFRSNSGGFHIQFDNGICLSTQFGPGNYGDNHDAPIVGEDAKRYQSERVEIAVWDCWKPKEPWMTKQMAQEVGFEWNNDVGEYLEGEDWLKVFDWCRNYVRAG